MINPYLQIPDGYDLHWSSNGDAILTKNDEVFAFAAEIALFLEGFATVRPLIHFGGVLEAMAALGLAKTEPSVREGKLKELFVQFGGQVRNVGAFGATLCKNVPAAADPMPLHAIRGMGFSNSAYASYTYTVFGSAEEESAWFPGTVDFEVETNEVRFSLEEIAHWFAHGRGSVGEDVGEQLVEELAATKPPSLAGVLAALTQRQRLAGAVPFVAQLVSALTLPPRRLAQNELPLGGYADVTTRGQPEHLLPSQFALDDLEFVRRFAGGELLYFRREEPHAPLREELVVLLDQGARTWGDVRLVLGAAVFALGKRCVTRKLPLQVAATSNEGRLLDPLTADAEALGQLLEASDLSLHPALALETVLRAPTTAARDIVLLTHPRNLAEPDVAAAARCLQAGSRLFALTVDDAGRAALAELRHGVPVAVAQFRIDWALKASENVPLPPVIGAAPEGWRGHVEPIPFPFRFGLTSKPTHFAFDQAGEILLIASGNGILHAHHTDGSRTEVLPRGMHKGVVLSEVEAVLGVPDGFVVCGRIDTELVLAHYDWRSRACHVHGIGAMPGKTRWWTYLQRYHCVVARGRRIVLGFDLATQEQAASQRGKQIDARNRVLQACREVWTENPLPGRGVGIAVSGPQFFRSGTKVQSDPDTFVVLTSEPSPALPDLTRYQHPVVGLDARTGELAFGDDMVGWMRWAPKADGLPMLKGRTILSAQFAAGVLVLATSLTSSSTSMLSVFSAGDGFPYRELPYRSPRGPMFVLSQNSARLARQTAEMQIAVEDTIHGGRPISVTPVSGCHNNLQIALGNYWLTLTIGGRAHLLVWNDGALTVDHIYPSSSAILKAVLQAAGLDESTGSRGKFDPAWSKVWYDRKRFGEPVTASLVAIPDCFGQVALFSKRQELLCMFFVFRDKLAAWMPDGTRYGPASVTGWSETPDALARIGKVLRDATERRTP